MALGLNYLHHCEPPVLHLDLKSANVLLDESGTAKVCEGGGAPDCEPPRSHRAGLAHRAGVRLRALALDGGRGEQL